MQKRRPTRGEHAESSGTRHPRSSKDLALFASRQPLSDALPNYQSWIDGTYAYIALTGGGSLVTADILAATVGISLGTAAPVILLGALAAISTAGAPGLPAWAPSATPYVVQGNLMGLVGTVQTFALLRKLRVREAEAFSEVAARLAWVVSAFSDGCKERPAPASFQQRHQLSGRPTAVGSDAWSQWAPPFPVANPGLLFVVFKGFPGRRSATRIDL